VASFKRNSGQVRRVSHDVVAGGGSLSHSEIERRLLEGFGVSAGSQSAVSLSVAGTLGIGSNLAPLALLAGDSTATGVRMDLKQAPTGAALTVRLLTGETDWMELVIPAGSTSVVADDVVVAAAASIPAASNIRVDIVGVGTTFPGSDLTVSIYL
jgi:hypothetical protein